MCFTPDSKEVYYLDDGRINVVALDKREPRPVAVTAELDVDFSKEKMVVFDEAWRLLRDDFFDPAFNGVDWQAARARTEPFVAAARTPDEMRRIVEPDDRRAERLASRHQRAAGRRQRGGGRPSRARLRSRGVRVVGTAEGGRQSWRLVRPRSPAASSAATSSWPWTARRVGAHVNLDALLENKINRRVVLKVVEGFGGARPRDGRGRAPDRRRRRSADCAIASGSPSGGPTCAKISDGRLGYVHMPDMSAASLAQLYVDLDADNMARDGVVIDVRNNNGGFVNVYALDVLSRRPFLNMTQRGTPTWSARSLLGQRSLERPTVLVTNQHSLSDAEDFTEGYRAMGLGKVVGEPTAGWIIYTWNTRLLDGTILRLPRVADYGPQRRADGDAPAAGRYRGQTRPSARATGRATRSSTRPSRRCSRP